MTDSDLDALPDEIEPLVGSSPTDPDTDQDGFMDGIEWVLGTSPADPTSIPDPKPAMRSYAYQVQDQIRVFCGVFPADPAMVGCFRFLVGSDTFRNAPEGDPLTGLGIVDITSFFTLLGTSFTEAKFHGLTLVGFNVDLPTYLLVNHGQLNVALAATLADTPVVEQLYLGVQGTTGYVLGGGPAMPGGAASFAIQPLDPVPLPQDELPEYCEVGFGNATPVGIASVEYTVTSAACAPDGLLYCIDADCTALAGQTFVLVDYGFLQSKTQ